MLQHTHTLSILSHVTHFLNSIHQNVLCGFLDGYIPFLSRKSNQATSLELKWRRMSGAYSGADQRLRNGGLTSAGTCAQSNTNLHTLRDILEVVVAMFPFSIYLFFFSICKAKDIYVLILARGGNLSLGYKCHLWLVTCRILGLKRKVVALCSSTPFWDLLLLPLSETNQIFEC